MNVLIVSLNFNPGHFSHLVANYKLFKDCGFTPYLYVNRSFNQMDEKNEFNKINSQHELRKLGTIDAAVFWFPCLKNIFEIIRMRILYKSKIVYIYHEPFESIRSYYNSGFRFKKIVKICSINLVNIPVILLSQRIILPSSSSFSLYQEKYAFLNKNYSLVPLLFDDEANFSLEKADKRFISYIGTIAADHAFDRFVDFVESVVRNDWFPKLNFLIATRNRIPVREKNILMPYLQSGRVTISEGHAMTNEEINQYYRDSLVVWNAYNRSMQSGVLPKAYMFGAAVIALFCNKNEFLDNHETGVLIKDNKDIIGIKKAVEEILKQKELFFQNCRNKFLEMFYYKNYERCYREFI